MSKKYLFVFVIIYLFAFGCGSNPKKGNVEHQQAIADVGIVVSEIDSISGSYLDLINSKHDFGSIVGEEIKTIFIDFEFKNKGLSPLIIYKADVSCGCMSVTYSKKPVLYREKSVITIKIDTENQKGMFNKTVFIKSNSHDDVKLIRIKGIIK